MNMKILPVLLCSSLFIGACSEERPARTVQEFLDNPQFLEAAVVRCSVNRAESRYDSECINARQAIDVVEARDERARRDRLEAESESKRDALRRTQRAASAARREAAERERLREEAAYLAQFGEELPPETVSDMPELEANTPGALRQNVEPTVQPAVVTTSGEPEVVFDEPVRAYSDSIPASDGGNAPAMNNDPGSTTDTDLTSIRDELKRRRQEESTN